jgi:hypothetical protein
MENYSAYSLTGSNCAAAAEMTLFSITKLRLFVRARVVSAIKLAGDRVQSSARFKRLVLRLLRGHPGLELKLRHIYLGSRYNEQLQSVNWPGAPGDSVVDQSGDISSDSEYRVSPPTPDGINANQRTPLEAYFHIYQGRL